jgi:peptide/nickel transport system substrate-binding protein
MSGCARAAAFFALVVAGACGAPRAQPKPSVLRAAVRADVTGFFPNPPAANESYTFEMNRWVLGAPVALDRGLDVVPALAEHWLTPDDRTFVLQLRPGLRFSDGRAATARDVAASLAAGTRKAWPNLGYLSTIASVRALDTERVEVVAARPDPTLLAQLAWGFVLPADAVDQVPVPVVGTAPYTLESWTPGVGFRFARNPYYWGVPGGFTRAEFRVVPGDAERIGLVEKGEADLADTVPPAAWDRLERSPRLRLVEGAGHRVLFLGLRVDRPPFDDPRVREAFDLAIDRDAIVERVFAGRGSPANQLLPRGAVGHVPDLPPRRYDPNRARTLLKAAGLRPGRRIQLDGPSNRYVCDVALMHEVARQLAAVGIEVEVNALDKSALYALLAAGRSDFHLLGWASESGDGADTFEVLFPAPGDKNARANPVLAQTNASGFYDAELAAITREAESSSNLQARAAVLRRAFARLAALRPVLPLVVQPEGVLYDPARVRWNPPVNLALRPGDLSPAKAPRP